MKRREHSWEEDRQIGDQNFAKVKAIWAILRAELGIYDDQTGWHVLYALQGGPYSDENGPYPNLTPEAITRDMVAEGLELWRKQRSE